MANLQRVFPPGDRPATVRVNEDGEEVERVLDEEFQRMRNEDAAQNENEDPRPADEAPEEQRCQGAEVDAVERLGQELALRPAEQHEVAGLHAMAHGPQVLDPGV